MPGLEGDRLITRSERVLHRSLGDEAVLYQLDSDQIAALDPIGALVWECLAFPGTVDELAADLADAFGREADEVRADITPLLEQLVELGMAVLTDAETPGTGGEAP